MNIKAELQSFAKGFVYASAGIIHCIKNERNMRFHFCAAFYVLILMRFYELSRGERAAVYIVIGLVIALEALNTAVEAVVDLVSPERTRFAGIAKDCAAGAVLAAAAAAAAVGIAVFWDKDAFGRIGRYFADNIPMLVLLVLSVPIWLAVIFLPSGKNKGKDKEKEDE